MKLRNKKTGRIYDLSHLPQIEPIVELLLDGSMERYEEPKDYWFINSVGGVIQPSDTTDWEQQDAAYHKKIGNYFETKEEAEQAVEKLKTWKRLKDKKAKIVGWCYSDAVDLDGGGCNFDGDDIIVGIDSGECDVNDLDLLFGGEK